MGSCSAGAVWPCHLLPLDLLQAAGSLLGVGLMIRAYQITDAGRASVLEYLILPASAIWSYFIWGETPSLQAIGDGADCAGRQHHRTAGKGSGSLKRRVDSIAHLTRRLPRANGGGTAKHRFHCRRSPPVRHPLSARPSGPRRITMVAFAAMADRAHLAHFIGPCQQNGAGAGEKIALKINTQAVAHHRNAQIIHGAGQLPPDLILLRNCASSIKTQATFSVAKLRL